MIKIFYFSGSGKSRRLAEYFAKRLGTGIYDITKLKNEEDFSAKTAFIVFPVYCQNLPDPVTEFLPKMKAEKVFFIASYGKKSYGNVIKDAADITNAKVIAAACVPCGHSFLDEDDDFDFSALEPVFDKINSENPAVITSGKKDFYADLVPAKRTQLGVKLLKSKNCTHCGKCMENCPIGAMAENNIGKNCIRCLRCVNECPEKALSFKTLSFMKLYLTSGRKNETKIYL